MRVTAESSRVSYRSERRWPDVVGATDIEIDYGEPVEQNDLEVCLTARFHLYAFLRGTLVRADVNHPPWPLRRARVGRLSQTLTAVAGLPDPVGEPMAHYSPDLKVRVGAVRPVRIR
jgi:uncharacterized protein YqjF (DUF2071 family)